MTRSKGKSRTKRDKQILVALIGVAGTVCAAIIATLHNWVPADAHDTSRTHGSQISSVPESEPNTLPELPNIECSLDELATPSSDDEFAALLHQRGVTVIRHLEAKKVEALGALDADGRRAEAEIYREYYDKLCRAFIDLHRRNIEAVGTGHLILSHELTRDIHYLLWRYERDTFWSAFGDSQINYWIAFPPPSSYAKLYPGVMMTRTAGGNETEIKDEELWPDSEESALDRERLDRISRLLDEEVEEP
jgi:hypothetical protein